MSERKLSCKRGHLLTSDNIIEVNRRLMGANGKLRVSRLCRTCHNLRSLRDYYKSRIEYLLHERDHFQQAFELSGRRFDSMLVESFKQQINEANERLVQIEVELTKKL